MSTTIQKPVVCFLTTGLSRSAGGPFVSVSGLAKAITAGGLADVAVVGCYRKSSEWGKDARQWEGVNLAARACRGWRSSWDLSLAARLALSRHPARPSVVHLHGLWDAASVASFMLLRRADSPVVVSPRGMLEPWALEQSRWKKKAAWLAWQRKVLTRAALLHATSHEEYHHFRQLGLRAPVAVIPNGLEIPRGCDRGASQTKTGDQPKRCLFLSRLHPKKGLPMLLQAWADLEPSGWQLHIAGDGDPRYVQEMKNLAAQLGVDARFEGELAGDDKWRFLSSGTLFVLPTHSENFGIAVAEAMAVGLPVITTTGAPWSVLEAQGMGWWVAPQPGPIRDALREAFLSPAHRLAEMGLRGLSHARTEFAWPAIGERMARCYRWLTGNEARPADVLLN